MLVDADIDGVPLGDAGVESLLLERELIDLAFPDDFECKVDIFFDFVGWDFKAVDDLKLYDLLLLISFR